MPFHQRLLRLERSLGNRRKEDLATSLKEAEASRKIAKSSLKHVEAENNQHKKELSLKKGALENPHQKIMNLKAREASHKGVEAYKASKGCRQEKLLFTQPTFAEGMDNTRRKILKHYSNLNLDFLDEDKLNDDIPAEGALTPGAVVARIEEVTNASPT